MSDQERRKAEARLSTANTIAAVSLANEILSLIETANTALQAVSESIRKARSEGRDLTDDELRALRGRRTVLLGDLQADIARLQREG